MYTLGFAPLALNLKGAIFLSEQCGDSWIRAPRFEPLLGRTKRGVSKPTVYHFPYNSSFCLYNKLQTTVPNKRHICYKGKLKNTINRRLLTPLFGGPNLRPEFMTRDRSDPFVAQRRACAVVQHHYYNYYYYYYYY